MRSVIWPAAGLLQPLHRRLDLLSRFQPTNADHPAVDASSVLVLPAVEEDVPLLFGHLEDGAGLRLDPPFLGPGADGLAGELGDGFGIAGVGHPACMPDGRDK